MNKVASFDEWKGEADSSSDPNFKAIGSTDLNPRPSLRSPFDRGEAKGEHLLGFALKRICLAALCSFVVLLKPDLINHRGEAV